MRNILYTGFFFEDSDLKVLNDLRSKVMSHWLISNPGRQLDEYHCTIQFKPTDIQDTLEYKNFDGNLNLELYQFGINPEGCIAVSGFINGMQDRLFHITLWCDKSCTPYKSNFIKKWIPLTKEITLHPYLGYMSENKWIVRL